MEWWIIVVILAALAFTASGLYREWQWYDTVKRRRKDGPDEW